MCVMCRCHVCHVSCVGVMCHVSCVMCHVCHVTCVSCDMCRCHVWCQVSCVMCRVTCVGVMSCVMCVMCRCHVWCHVWCCLRLRCLPHQPLMFGGSICPPRQPHMRRIGQGPPLSCNATAVFMYKTFPFLHTRCKLLHFR